jgi:hypothetical protein
LNATVNYDSQNDFLGDPNTSQPKAFQHITAASVIDYIHCVSGSYEHRHRFGAGRVIEPIQMCSNYSKMSALQPCLVAKYGQDVTNQILYLNAPRVLHMGWDGAVT